MKILTENERLTIARNLAKQAHKTQLDKVGEPYFYHLERVANACQSIPAKIVAYLHDITEDGHMTHAELESLGVFTGHELYCIKVLDKKYHGGLSIAHMLDKRDELHGYLKIIKSMPLALEVKLADLRDNSNVERFHRNNKRLTDKDRERLKKYERSIAYLMG